MSDYTAADAHAAAARGAAWLDEKCPNWVEHINLEELAMREADQCILGQTSDCLVGPGFIPRWESQSGFYRVLDWAGWIGSGVPARLGFDMPERVAVSATEWEMLTIAWRELIRERLAVTA